MKTRTRPHRSRKGIALLSIMSYLVLASILTSALLRSASTHYQLADRKVSYQRAFLLAEGGLEQAAQYISDMEGQIVRETVRRGEHENGRFEATITPLESPGEFRIASTGYFQSGEVTVEVERAYFPSYAGYLMWSHENGPYYFTAGENLFGGRVHANDRLYFQPGSWEDESRAGLLDRVESMALTLAYEPPATGGPVFTKLVTSGADSFGGSIEGVTFMEGFKYPRPMAPLHEAIDFHDLSWNAQRHGTVFNGLTVLRLDGDTLRVTNPRAGLVDAPLRLEGNPIVYVQDASPVPSALPPVLDSDTQNLLGADVVDLLEDLSPLEGSIVLLGGELNGRLTLVAEEDIHLLDHLRYAEDPRSVPESDDMLGLIAKDDVWVSPLAPPDLDVHAAILAAGTEPGERGSFGVLLHRAGLPKGELRLFGSVVQDLRGGVGTFFTRTGHQASGYQKAYTFDDRFNWGAPPFYPLIKERVEFQGWRQVWKGDEATQG